MQDLNTRTIFGIIAVSLDAEIVNICNLRASVSRFQQSHIHVVRKFFRQESKVPICICQCYKNHAQSLLVLAILLVLGLKYYVGFKTKRVQMGLFTSGTCR